MGQGWADEASLVRSYQNIQRLSRTPADKTLVIPDAADPTGWEQVFGRLGRPADPTGYKFPDDLKLTDDQKAVFSKLAHDGHFTTWQWEKVLPLYTGLIAKQEADAKTAFEARQTTDWGELQRNWGDSFGANTQVAAEAIRRLGFSEEDVDKFEAQYGTKRTVEFFYGLGRGMGEMPAAGGGPGSGQPEGAASGFGLTPEAAKAKLDGLSGDPQWVARMRSKDASVSKAALEEQRMLADIAAPLIEQEMARGGMRRR